MVDELEDNSESHTGPAPHDPGRTNRIVTLPNLLCVVRLLGSFVLVWIAYLGKSETFLWLFIGLTMTDWIDGKLAILLDQRTVIGARLDSWADATLYAALFVGALLLHPKILSSEMIWIIPAIASYTISTLAGLWKFKRWPSYHTRAAKTSWFLILVGAAGLFAGWSLWPLRIALVGIVLANIEALLITLLSSRWQADVGSIFRVLRSRKDP